MVNALHPEELFCHLFSSSSSFLLRRHCVALLRDFIAGRRSKFKSCSRRIFISIVTYDMYIKLCIKTTKKDLKTGAEIIKILMYQSHESYQNIGIACSDSDKIFLRALKIFS